MIKTTAWKVAPAADQAYVWNASGAIAAALFLGLLGLVFMSAEVWLVVALAAGIELQTAACSIWFLHSPYVIKPGEELCSAGLQFPVGLVLLWCYACVAMHLRGRK